MLLRDPTGRCTEGWEASCWDGLQQWKPYSSQAFLDDTQLIFEVAGVFFDPLDAVNAGIYLRRGQHENAFWSACSLLPIGGIIGNIAKRWRQGISIADDILEVAPSLGRHPSGFVDDIEHYGLHGRRARSGNSGGGSGGNDAPLKQVFTRKVDAPNWSTDFVRASVIEEKVKNKTLLAKLREIEPGDWVKVYENGYSGGEMVSVHYFRSKSGKIFDLWVKRGWS